MYSPSPASLNVSEDYIPATQVVDDDAEEEEEEENSVISSQGKVWGGLVPLMEGLDYVQLVKNEYTFGRSSGCEVVIADPRVSGKHCSVYRRSRGGGGKGGSAPLSQSSNASSSTYDVFIVDSSANGTYLNGKRLEKNKPVPLESSDKISFVLRKESKKTKKKPAGLFMYQKNELEDRNDVSQKYELRKVLGTGACGQVVEAIERGTGKRFAVKIIEKKRLAQHAQGATDPASLLREAEILKRVQHPNITAFKELFQTGKVIYIVMEYVGGGELLDHILERGHYEEWEAAVILRQILDAVKYLHDRGIVHRDLKPENILLTRRKGGEPASGDPLDLKITDFGLAKFLGNEGLRTYCGTPQYFAPEVLSRKSTVFGMGRYGKAVDMWSIGVILYVLLTGVPPFDDDVLFDQIEGAAYDTTCDRWPLLSKRAKDLIARLLTRSPQARLTAEQALAHPFVVECPRVKPRLGEKVDVSAGDAEYSKLTSGLTTTSEKENSSSTGSNCSSVMTVNVSSPVSSPMTSTSTKRARDNNGNVDMASLGPPSQKARRGVSSSGGGDETHDLTGGGTKLA
eukprot:g2678.t1